MMYFVAFLALVAGVLLAAVVYYLVARFLLPRDPVQDSESSHRMYED